MPTIGMHMQPTFAKAITTTNHNNTAWITLQALYIRHINTNSITNTQMCLGYHVPFPRLPLLIHKQVLSILRFPRKPIPLIHSLWMSVLLRSHMGFHTNLRTRFTDPVINALSHDKTDWNRPFCFPLILCVR